MALHLLHEHTFLGRHTSLYYALAMFSFSSVSRGDDARQLRLCSLSRPIKLDQVKPEECFIIPIIIDATKTSKGQLDYKLLVRSLEPLVCAQGAMVRYLVERFTLGQEPVPDPRDYEAWIRPHLFVGNNPNEEVAYEGHKNACARMYDSVGIVMGPKTHGFRRGGAQYLEAQGVSLDQIKRMGQWALSVLEKTYLLFFTPEAVLAAGGFPGASTKDITKFWAARFTRVMPEALLLKIFPCLKALKEGLEKLEATNRIVPSVQGVIASLEYLATVFFQDCLDMAHTGLCFNSEGICTNPSINFLREDPIFQAELAQYSTLHAIGISSPSGLAQWRRSWVTCTRPLPD